MLDATVPHMIDTMHRRAADALREASSGGRGRLKRRARHFAPLHADGEAARALTTAAEARLEEHALLAADRLANAALVIAPDLDTSAAAADTLARSLTAQGRWSEALQLDSATVVEYGENPNAAIAWPSRRSRPADRGWLARSSPRAIASGDASAFIHIAAGRATLVEGEGLAALECAQRGLDGAAIEADLDARLAALELQGHALDYLGSRDEAEAAWTQQATEAAAGRGRRRSSERLSSSARWSCSPADLRSGCMKPSNSPAAPAPWWSWRGPRNLQHQPRPQW